MNSHHAEMGEIERKFGPRGIELSDRLRARDRGADVWILDTDTKRAIKGKEKEERKLETPNSMKTKKK